jgi:hypothetical protein
MQKFLGRPQPDISNRGTEFRPNQNCKSPSFDGAKGIFVSTVIPKVRRCNISARFAQNGENCVPFVLSRGAKFQSTVKRQEFQAMFLNQGLADLANLDFGGALISGRQPAPMYGNASWLRLDAVPESIANERAACGLQGKTVLNPRRIHLVPAIGKQSLRPMASPNLRLGMDSAQE